MKYLDCETQKNEAVPQNLQAGFGLIESLIALGILAFVFLAFMSMMLRVSVVGNQTMRATNIGYLLDNKIEKAWITSSTIITPVTQGGVTYTQAGTFLVGSDTSLNVHQKRIITHDSYAFLKKV